MSVVFKRVIIMNKKTISTYDRLMQDEGFKSDYKKEYEEFALSELLLVLMDGDNKSVRKLAKEAGLSANTIQNIRSGKQKDIRLQSFKNIAQAYGYELVLEKEGERISVAWFWVVWENIIGMQCDLCPFFLAL